MIVSSISPDDPSIVPIFRQIFEDEALFHQNSWSKTNSGPRKAWIATDQGKLIGAAIVRWKDEPHIWLMAVLPEHRGKGAGSRLMETIEQTAREQDRNSITVTTFRKWPAMRSMLKKRRWVFEQAQISDKHNGGEELWSLSLRKTPLNVLVIGANPNGRGGEWIEAIERHPELFTITGICDSSAAVREHWIGKGIPGFQSVEQAMLSDQPPQAAIMALPHYLYRDYRIQCHAAGLAMLHEKPLACTLNELQELAELMSQSPFHLIVGVQRRTHPSYVVLKEKLSADIPSTLVISMELGRTVPLEGWRRSQSASGGGALLDMGFHAIDLVHYLLDSTIEPISCCCWSIDSETNQLRPALADEVETAATITGRCGATWVRIMVNRSGVKTESVVAQGKSKWRANRDAVTQNNKPVFLCDSDWILSLDGCLSVLSRKTMTIPKPMDLWDHFSTMRVVEHAKSLVRLTGFKSTEPRHV